MVGSNWLLIIRSITLNPKQTKDLALLLKRQLWYRMNKVYIIDWAMFATTNSPMSLPTGNASPTPDSKGCTPP